MLILAVSKDFDKLFENGGLTTIAPLGELCGIVIVTVDLRVMFVITVLSAKNRGADRASKVLDVVLAIQCCNVGAS
jgi:hypothetical protein